MYPSPFPLHSFSLRAASESQHFSTYWGIYAVLLKQDGASRVRRPIPHILRVIPYTVHLQDGSFRLSVAVTGQHPAASRFQPAFTSLPSKWKSTLD